MMMMMMMMTTFFEKNVNKKNWLFLQNLANHTEHFENWQQYPATISNGRLLPSVGCRKGASGVGRNHLQEGPRPMTSWWVRDESKNLRVVLLGNADENWLGNHAFL